MNLVIYERIVEIELFRVLGVSISTDRQFWCSVYYVNINFVFSAPIIVAVVIRYTVVHPRPAGMLILGCIKYHA